MLRFVSLPRLLLPVFMIILMTGAIPPASVNSAPALLAADIPTTVFPTAAIPITRVVYVWTAVSGATQYQFQVAQNGNTFFDKQRDSSVCAGGTCNVKPNIDLASGSYSWRVRAMVNNTWLGYSGWQAFSISAQSTGFSSTFTDNAAGWSIHKGQWTLESSNYFTTTGVAGRVSSISYNANFSTLDYEARVLRNGCPGCANVLIIRGNPVLDSTGWWNTEYTFDYTNNGLFSVWRDHNGSYVALKNWTSTSAINKGGWNTLRVTASGSQLKFYINGTLVWSGTDSTYSSGKVGIGMYRNTSSTGDKFFVDWAQLDTSVPVTANAELVDESGIEVPGGDKNMAP